MGYVLDIAERESEVIAPKRERESWAQIGSLQVSPKVDFGIHVGLQTLPQSKKIRSKIDVKKRREKNAIKMPT